MTRHLQPARNSRLAPTLRRNLLDRLAVWRRKRGPRLALQDLPPDLLRDLGINAMGVRREACKPVRRP